MRSDSGIIINVNNISSGTINARTQLRIKVLEFFALKVATDIIDSMRYKLRCFVVTVDSTTEDCFDNRSVVKNSSIPTRVLNKMHNAICCHRVRDYQSEDVLRVWWMPV